jgi:hypothetical protein
MLKLLFAHASVAGKKEKSRNEIESPSVSRQSCVIPVSSCSINNGRGAHECQSEFTVHHILPRAKSTHRNNNKRKKLRLRGLFHHSRCSSCIQ